MKIKWYILLFMFSSCFHSEDSTEKIESFNVNTDSLFNAADSAVQLVNNNRKQKVLLEQDLWRKKRDIKVIEQKYTDSIWNLSNMYELNTIKLDSDSVQYNYKIILREIVDTQRS